MNVVILYVHNNINILRICTFKMQILSDMRM